MKRIAFIFSALGLLLGTARAQIALSPQQGITVTGGYSGTSTLSTSVVIRNLSGRATTMKVQRTVLSNVAGSSNNFCFGPNCYPATVSVSPTPSIIQAGENDSTFIADYAPQNNPGVAVIKYTFFSISNPADTASIVITFDATAPTGVNQSINKVSFGAPFPNPATTHSTITHKVFGPSEQASVSVYDILGNLKSVTNIEPFTTETQLPVANLNEGAYICKYIYKGKTISTRRLTVVR